MLPPLALLIAGCAGSKPHWDPITHELAHGEVRYRVGPLSPGWEIVLTRKTAIGFYNRDVGGVIASDASCRDDAEAVALTVLTNQLLIGYTDRHIRSSREEMLDRRAAQHTIVDARLDGVAQRLDLYVLKRNGCIFDLSYVGPPDRYLRGLPDFRRFVAGFADERDLT